ncbi:MAG: YqgE/AlgH family protein [Prosthecobacter sp.]|nr:YqgE/AlgH family protein [Prosthecobacter sp.]
MPPNPPDVPSLSGRLLLAAPTMRDPNFRHAVIFMAAHTSDDGAFGYILNRPLEQRVADLLPDQDLGDLGQVPVYIGGPVSTDKLAFASMHWNKKSGTLRCQTHLSVADALLELSMGHEVRGFVGYTGWSEGQLEGELRKRSWITTPARKAILAAEKSPKLWASILEDMGPLYTLMAHTPENVQLN